MKSVMVNQFKQLPDVSFGRNTFNRSSGSLLTLDAGKIYPVWYDEVVPGDTKKLTMSFFGRINTMIVPSYVNLYLDAHLWFVPRRLVWEDWSFFLGETVNNYGTSSPDPDSLLVPIVTAPEGGFESCELLDYFTMPPGINNLFIDACYPRSYNLIWNTFYRSETLQEAVKVPVVSEDDDPSLYKLLPRGKRFDYFTSCLPEPQRGESVYLPIGSTAPVVGDGNRVAFAFDRGDIPTYLITSGQTSGNTRVIGVDPGGPSGSPLSLAKESTGMVADLSQSTSLSVQAFRNLVALQQFLERENRYGTRLQELVYGHFGVTAPDYRLQYPEYLGGTTIRLNVSSVPQTSSTETASVYIQEEMSLLRQKLEANKKSLNALSDEEQSSYLQTLARYNDLSRAVTSTPQGNLAAYGTLSDTGSGFYRSFVEHGIILCLVSIRGDLRYQQGVDRMLTRRKKLDFMYPEFVGISDQEVYNREIYADGTSADAEIFGYQERYGEYRYHNSYVMGKMRSSDPQSLDIWHDAQYFENRPKLNAEFIEENPPIERLIAVPSEPQFTLDCLFELADTRELPLFGIPGLQRL